jgi:molybdopterin-guanine dinucleotide biosynthesis protein A
MPSAAILAGGRASRLGGRDKSRLLVGGRLILDRQLTELSQLTDDILLVGAEPPPGSVARFVADRVNGLGPLGGLDAALAFARDEIVAVVACDMPNVTARFLAALVDHLHGADAVVPRTDAGCHPLCAIYTRACLPAVARRLSTGQLAMRGLLEDVRVRVIDRRELSTFDCDQLLTNVNTPDELESLEALQGHEP